MTEAEEIDKILANVRRHFGKDLFSRERQPNLRLMQQVNMILRILETATDPVSLASAPIALWLLYHSNTNAASSLYVTKQVSDDLLRSDIPDPDFANVTWPATFLEVTYEDPRIPNMLVARQHLEEFENWIEQTSRRPIYKGADSLPDAERTPDIMTILPGKTSSQVSQFQQTFAQVDALARGETDQPVHERSTGDTDTMAAAPVLMLLFFKVLLFASIPKFSPRVRVRKFPPPAAGLLRRAPIKEFVVEYLPHHIATKKEEAEKLGQSHAFFGRRGHFRTYASARYVNKQGDRDYIPPVPNPQGADVKRKFIVRKP